MRYTAIIAAAAFTGSAVAQGVPACAAGPVQAALTAIGGPANIGDLCANKNGVLTTLTAALEAACDCADLNTAIGLAGTFCPSLNIPKKDCSATSSAPAPVSSAPVSSAPVSSAPVSSAPVSSAPVSSAPASTTVVVSTTATLSSVSGKPTPSTNGTIVTPPPSSTSVVTGSGSALQMGGVAMVGAFLAALAL